MPKLAQKLRRYEMMNFDHPLHDDDPYNDGKPDTDYPDEVEGYCTNCGYDVLSPGRELCDQCFKDYHGPDDSDYDPECCGGFSIEVCPC
jgi:hypothetical protein